MAIVSEAERKQNHINFDIKKPPVQGGLCIEQIRGYFTQC